MMRVVVDDAMRAEGDERGVTVVELVVVIAILGLITTALTSALYVGFRATTDNQRGLDQSGVEQVLASYLTADVQGACNHAHAAPSCPRSPNPATSTTPANACGANAVFAIDGVTSATAAAADITTAYVLQGGTLVRDRCPYGAAAPSSTVNIGNNVTSVVASYPTSGACSGQFQVVVTVTGDAAANTADYTFALCAHGRA